MKIKGIIVFFGLLCSVVALSGEPGPGPKQPTLQVSELPIGSLGFPVGSYLTIEGLRLDGFKAGVHTLRVDTVNGYKLAKPVAIWVEKTEPLPKETRCTLKGYETLEMIGMPPAYLEADKEAGNAAAGWLAGPFLLCDLVHRKPKWLEA